MQIALNGLFAESPYNEYRNYFNIYRIEVTSAESGADHPATGILKNTALDAAYDCGGITRLICVDTAKVNAVIAASVPAPTAHDLVLVIVNDPQYGGSGGSVAVASTNAAAVEIVLHETGHTLALLADEYRRTTAPGLQQRRRAISGERDQGSSPARTSSGTRGSTRRPPFPRRERRTDSQACSRVPLTATPVCSARPTRRR